MGMLGSLISREGEGGVEVKGGRRNICMMRGRGRRVIMAADEDILLSLRNGGRAYICNCRAVLGREESIGQGLLIEESSLPLGKVDVDSCKVRLGREKTNHRRPPTKEPRHPVNRECGSDRLQGGSRDGPEKGMSRWFSS